jgi:hypothetical protein
MVVVQKREKDGHPKKRWLREGQNLSALCCQRCSYFQELGLNDGSELPATPRVPSSEHVAGVCGHLSPSKLHD